MANLDDRISAFIEKAKATHVDSNFSYERVLETYVNNRTVVCIVDNSIDPKTGEKYGEFWVTPSNFLKGRKNPCRRNENISRSKRFNQDDFINRCRKVHDGENLDYSQVVYKGAHEKIFIIDNDINPNTGEIYGGYWQEANSHLRGCKHPLKAIALQAQTMSDTTENFILKAMKIHEGKGYSYDKVAYVNNRTKVIITCPKHGDFLISPDNFLAGKGCPVCGYHLSKAEVEIYNYVCDVVGKDCVVRNDKKVIDGKELDIYIPSRKIAIEYNGLRWHTEDFGKGRNYHLQKLQECQEKGITLLQIFEDEYIDRKDVVLAKIGHMLGGDSILPKVMARKCEIREIKKDDASKFLGRYHIQGFTNSTVYLGCFYNNILIGVMCFKNEGNEWNLTRFASDYHYVCQGVGGKLFNFFLSHYSPNVVKTFLDRRWAFNISNNLYTKLGFEIDKIEAPDYTYTQGHGERLHKFGFRKQILHRKYGLPLSMTEKEMASKLGYSRIWNCGLIRYIWKKKDA